MKSFRIYLGRFIKKIGEKIQPNYWICNQCDHIVFKEEEIMCWICGSGEMIYKG